jgi:hypothetical protein
VRVGHRAHGAVGAGDLEDDRLVGDGGSPGVQHAPDVHRLHAGVVLLWAEAGAGRARPAAVNTAVVPIAVTAAARCESGERMVLLKSQAPVS